MKTAGKQFQFKSEAATPRSSLKIGEVSQASGIGVEALRFYERSGLLGSPGRTASGYRVYNANVLDRLAFIKKAQTLGFSLDEIRRVIEESEAGESPCAEVREIVRARLQKIDEHLSDLRRYRKELAATLADWDEQGAATGDICGLIENSNVEAEQSVAATGLKRGRKNKKSR
ncbi:MAG TPA: heavy metal-responsive transcriptional regulator [Pyrinomonadaceae bacterium]|nr:heavy metal-responsive transcriptional regulator [Pyrinomonadaceae bacterium]